MKKIVLLAMLSVASMSSAFAQVTMKGVVGLNSSNIANLGSKIGFHAGVNVDMPLPRLSENVYGSVGALLSLKGCNQDYGELASQKLNAYYLEVPVHLGYKHEVNDQLAIWGEAGPYVALGAFGKAKGKVIEDINGGMEEFSEDTFGDPGLKRFDFGAGFKIGVTFKEKYTCSIGYDWGFVDIYKGSSLDEDHDECIDLTPTAKNKNLSISIGYIF